MSSLIPTNWSRQTRPREYIILIHFESNSNMIHSILWTLQTNLTPKSWVNSIIKKKLKLFFFNFQEIWIIVANFYFIENKKIVCISCYHFSENKVNKRTKIIPKSSLYFFIASFFKMKMKGHKFKVPHCKTLIIDEPSFYQYIFTKKHRTKKDLRV